MDRIMMKIDDFLETHSSFNTLTAILEDEIEKVRRLNVGWWTSPAADDLKRSLDIWAIQSQAIVDEVKTFYMRIDYEVEEWTTTDLKYDYEGEEIDTVAEMQQLYWDLLSGDLKLDDLVATIDLKEIFNSNLPWDWRYPPAKTSVWVQVGDQWVRTEATGPDWDLELSLSPLGASLEGGWDAGSMDVLASLGDGYVAGYSFELLSLEASAGYSFVTGKPTTSAEVFVLTGEGFAGRNISEFDYIGYHVGVNILGWETGEKINEISGELAWWVSLEAGIDIDKPRDPTPPDRVP